MSSVTESRLFRAERHNGSVIAARFLRGTRRTHPFESSFLSSTFKSCLSSSMSLVKTPEGIARSLAQVRA